MILTSIILQKMNLTQGVMSEMDRQQGMGQQSPLEEGIVCSTVTFDR